MTICEDNPLPRDTRPIDRPGGNVWHIKYRLAEELWGQPSPKDGRPTGKTLRVSLETTEHAEAVARRDVLLVKLREMAAKIRGDDGTSDQAALRWGIAWADGSIRPIEHEVQLDSGEAVVAEDYVEIDAIQLQYEEVRRKKGIVKADHWLDIAMGRATPYEKVAERYIDHRDGELSVATINDLRTETKRFTEWATEQPEGAVFQSVTRAMAHRFAVEHLPTLKTKDGKAGLSWQSIKKSVSCQKGLWDFAIQSGLLPVETRNPWERLPLPRDRKQRAPATRLDRDSSEIGIFTPTQWASIIVASPEATPLGDTVRIALVTACRLSEITNRMTADVAEDGRAFVVPDAKIPSRIRFIPLHDETAAQKIVMRRRALPEDSCSPICPIVDLLPAGASTSAKPSHASADPSLERRATAS